MNIKGLSLGELGTNGYIIYKNGEGLMIDPGGNIEIIDHWLIKNNIKPIAILLTHAHFDHIGAVDDLRDTYKIPVYVHEMEADWLATPELNGSGLFPVTNVSCRPADYFIKEGRMEIGQFKFDVMHTPGHSPGGVSFIFNDKKYVISGDCIFQNGIGRTDLPGGDHTELLNSIKNKLFSLKDDFVIYPGHGPTTTIYQEKNSNPFI
ncbi:putative metallo-hydrolase [Paraliobacillus sp. PM-2]|uniref:MBL fold metallo-hydrolase n=1 Tax=Paraliobacillus sp. PM-2 TaxID=1462524 RepID=UPI00061CAE28|nr:MBL fold metallo-hydrolase [Paraliobacillus sp. PM-2]CQR46838.1 putative metallo-hydrolase [Paraliobacillus sp. PM-2]